jgi:hypothetical protein
MSKLAQSIRIKLAAYAEMTGKSKIEALYDALSIAKSVREKTIDLKKLFVPVEPESRYTIQNRMRAEKQRIYSKQYYQKNNGRLKARKKELRLIKNRKMAV